MLKNTLLTVICALMCALPCVAASFEEAESLYREGRLDNAILKATAVAKEAESARDTTTLIKAWCILGMSYAEKGDVVQVANYTHNLIGVLGEVGEDFRYVTTALYASAQIYRKSNQPEQAIKYLEMSICYESQLNRPTILAQRYIELSAAYGDVEKWDKAFEVMNNAIDLYGEGHNGFVFSLMYYQKGVCEKNLGKEADALNSFRRSRATHIKAMKADYKVSPKCLINLAEYALGQDKTDSARFFYSKAVESASVMKDGNTEHQALLGLASIEESDSLREMYLRRADSLSFASYVSEFTAKSASSIIDFPQKEQAQKIRHQKNVLVILTLVIVLILLLTVSLTYNVRSYREKAIFEAEKNAALAESNLQKDRLLALASAAVEEKERREIKKIAQNMGDPADIKLTKREREVAKYASEGLQNKEIAAALGINTRTVEAHRNSLYRKFGINNAVELSNYMNRIKYMQSKES